MADNVNPQPGATVEPDVTTPEGLAAHNASVIAKTNAQGVEGGFDLDAPASSALDSLRDTLVKQKQEEQDQNDPAKKAAADAEAKRLADEQTAAKEREELQRKAAEGDTTSATRLKEIEDARTAEETKRKEEEERQVALKNQADAIFKDSPTLAPNASPKSGEAFAAVKIKAAQEIGQRDQTIAEQKRQIEELTKAAAQPLTDEVKKELTELREFRARLDIEVNPKFKEFDAKANETREFVYAQLKKSPVVSDAVIADIKKLGGPEMVNLDKLFDSINDPTLKRLVESSIAEIEKTKYAKDQAIAAAKADVRKFQQEQEEAWKNVATAHNQHTRQYLAEITAKIPWLNDATPDPKAKDAAAEAKRVEAHNTVAKKFREELESALNDDSPQMRATMAVGMAQLFRYQTLHEALNTEHKKVVQQLADANATIERLKSAGASRLRTSGAPAGGQLPAPKPTGLNLDERAGDALDRMRQEAAAARAQQ